jgi:hypothetical protein
MPSQSLMLCNYTSKYTKKFLEGFYVIRTTIGGWWWCGMIFVLTFASIMPIYMMWDDLCLHICLHCCQPTWCGMIFVFTFASIVPTYMMRSRSITSWWWWWWWLHRWSNKPPPSHGYFSSLMWQTKGRSSDLYVRYQKGLHVLGVCQRRKGSSTHHNNLMVSVPFD